MDRPERLKDRVSISQLLGDIASRQVQYYLSACMYLGIVDENKEFTEFGKSLRNKSSNTQNIELIQTILSNCVFGTVYVTEKMFQMKLKRDDVIEIMKKYIQFNS